MHNDVKKIFFHKYFDKQQKVSLHFNGHFPGETQLARARISQFWIYLAG